jgi:hypothetical protein
MESAEQVKQAETFENCVLINFAMDLYPKQVRPARKIAGLVRSLCYAVVFPCTCFTWEEEQPDDASCWAMYPARDGDGENEQHSAYALHARANQVGLVVQVQVLSSFAWKAVIIKHAGAADGFFCCQLHLACCLSPSATLQMPNARWRVANVLC